MSRFLQKLRRLMDACSFEPPSRQSYHDACCVAPTLAMGDDIYRHWHVTAWCDANGYTDPVIAGRYWWAFPPNAVMATPIAIASLLDLGQHR